MTTGTESRPPVSALLVLAFSLVGIGIAIYLTIVHYAKVPLTCAASGGKVLGIFPVNCTQVTQSAYSVIDHTNIPITVPGLIWFLVSGSLAGIVLLAWSKRLEPPSWITSVHMLWCVGGLAFVIYLVYAESVLIKSFCEWCSGVHVLVILTFVTVLIRWQRVMAGRYAKR